VQAEAQKVFQRRREEERLYDQMTGHGATQGARFP